MKKYFVVSLIKNGILGGGLVADEQGLQYHTGKVSIPSEYRRIVMKYADICKATAGGFVLFPTIRIGMRSGETYRFAVFGGRKCLMNILREMGVDVSDD